jgi:HD-GYP domain-containing protein (c-di-GMP phosphodiesterase class II)
VRTVEWALQELSRYAGTQIDPEIVCLLVNMVRADPALLQRLVAHRIAIAA